MRGCERNVAEAGPPMNTLHRRHASNLTRRLVGVALLALLLAQWTALAHAWAHGPLHISGHISGQPAAEAEADVTWDHDAGSSACQLVDHLLIGQAAGAASAAVPFFLATTPPAAAPGGPIARGLALRAYEARGPPRA